MFNNIKNFNHLRVVFLGNPEIGQKVFKNLVNKKKIKILAFITYSVSEELEILSKKMKFKLIKVPKYNLKKHFNKVKILKPDLIFEYGWSEILDVRFLNLCPIIGQHPSLLPKRRGRAPITWAILDGLKYTGVTIFYLDQKVDNGNIIYQKKILISKNETSNTLLDKINSALSKLTIRYIDNFPNNPAKTQDHKKASYTNKRTVLDSEIKLSYKFSVLDKYFRALVPPYYPAPFIKTRFGDVIRIDKVTLIKKNDFYKKK